MHLLSQAVFFNENLKKMKNVAQYKNGYGFVSLVMGLAQRPNRCDNAGPAVIHMCTEQEEESDEPDVWQSLGQVAPEHIALAKEHSILTLDALKKCSNLKSGARVMISIFGAISNTFAKKFLDSCLRF
jgi:hypothetical protein